MSARVLRRPVSWMVIEPETRRTKSKHSLSASVLRLSTVMDGDFGRTPVDSYHHAKRARWVRNDLSGAHYSPMLRRKRLMKADAQSTRSSSETYMPPTVDRLGTLAEFTQTRAETGEDMVDARKLLSEPQK